MTPASPATNMRAVLSFEDICAIVDQRWGERSPVIAAMDEVRRRYNADYVIPMPELDTEPMSPQLSPLLIANAVDTPAMRAASVLPWLASPALDSAREKGRGSREWARTRTRAMQATLTASHWSLVRRRYYRHLSGYATTALAVLPGTAKTGYVPRIELRNPLGAFPQPKAPEDPSPPEDCAFVYELAAAKVRHRWPETAKERGGPIEPPGKTIFGEEMWAVFEWHDADQICWGLLGSTSPRFNQRDSPIVPSRPDRMALGDPVPNRAGYATVVCPERVTLDRIASSIASVVGIADLMDRFMRLGAVAAERAIFPDRYVIGAPGGSPRIVGGAWKDGRTGDTNILEDVTAVGELNSSANPGTNQLIGLLERNFNVSTGIPAPALGQSTDYSMRTGRGIDTLLGASIDPRVQELHEISENFLPHLLSCVSAVYEGWHGSRTYSLYSGQPNDDELVKFTPSVHLAERRDYTASYAIAGADVQLTTVALGQLRQLKAISMRTFRQRHPWIGDAAAEEARVSEEDLEEAVKMGIQRLLVQGEMPPIYAARIERYVKQGDDIFQAVEKADADARREQASVPPPPEPGMVAAPETMPGLAGPAGPVAPPVPPGGPPPSDDQRIQAVMAAMRQAPPAGGPGAPPALSPGPPAALPAGAAQ